MQRDHSRGREANKRKERTSMEGGGGEGQAKRGRRGRWRGGRGGRRGGRGGKNSPAEPMSVDEQGTSAKQNPPRSSNSSVKKGPSKPPLPPTQVESSAANTGDKGKLFSQETFRSLGLSEYVLQALEEKLQFETMTKTQAIAVPQALKGTDLVVKAKTGTGKTLGFLVPTVEQLVKQRPPKGKNISALIIAPTRDLSLQIFTVCQALCGNSFGSACVVGGINKNKDLNRFKTQIDILIATPGRLLDHLNTTAGFAKRFESLRVLVLDEADQLLEMGFEQDLKAVLSFLPPKKQGMFFSATYPDSVEKIVSQYLKADYVRLDTVAEASAETAELVEQHAIVVPLEQQLHVLCWMLKEHEKKQKGIGYKVMVFFPTARMVGFMSMLFKFCGFPVLEIHSRRSQGHRKKVLEEFRNETNKILFSSDLTARGMDFDDVTLVVQIGITERQQYIHRLGRTARIGAAGSGIIMVDPFEERLLKTLDPLPIVRMDAGEWTSKGAFANMSKAIANVALSENMTQLATQAYLSNLGFYVSKAKLVGKSRSQAAGFVNSFATIIGLPEPPQVELKLARKINLGPPDITIMPKASKQRPRNPPNHAKRNQSSN